MFTPLLLLSVCVLMNLRNTSIADVPEMSKEKVDERMRLVESVIATRVFETHVSNIPVLQPLFKEYERAQKYFIKDLRMGEFDRSCDRYWQDSLSVSGDFDKDFYERKEMFKVRLMNPQRSVNALVLTTFLISYCCRCFSSNADRPAESPSMFQKRVWLLHYSE